MTETRIQTVETIQKMVVKLLATEPAGHSLCLVGGFRHRFLDGSCRMSVDIDYHWDSGLEQKQRQLCALFSRHLLADVKEEMGYEGSVSPASGPMADSPMVKTINLAFWREGGAPGRIEIPVELTRILCLDKPVARTVDGTVYLTVSNQDMIESKMIAVFNRMHIEYRDLVDIFLFVNWVTEGTAARMRTKLARLKLAPAAIAMRLSDFHAHRAYHVKAIGQIVSTQLDQSAAATIRRAGGAAAVFDTALAALDRCCHQARQRR